MPPRSARSRPKSEAPAASSASAEPTKAAPAATAEPTKAAAAPAAAAAKRDPRHLLAGGERAVEAGIWLHSLQAGTTALAEALPQRNPVAVTDEFVALLGSLSTDKQQTEVCQHALRVAEESRLQQHGSEAEVLSNLARSKKHDFDPNQQWAQEWARAQRQRDKPGSSDPASFAWLAMSCPNAKKALKAEGVKVPVPRKPKAPRPRSSSGTATSSRAAPVPAAVPAPAPARVPARVPNAVDLLDRTQKEKLKAYAQLLRRSDEPRELVRRAMLRSREELQRELLTWESRGTRPDVEAWFKAVQRQVAAEVAATDRLTEREERRRAAAEKRSEKRAAVARLRVPS